MCVLSDVRAPLRLAGEFGSGAQRADRVAAKRARERMSLIIAWVYSVEGRDRRCL